LSFCRHCASYSYCGFNHYTFLGEARQHVSLEELQAALTSFVEGESKSLRAAAKTHAKNNYTTVTRYFNDFIRPLDQEAIAHSWPSETTKRKKIEAIDALTKKTMGNANFLNQVLSSYSIIIPSDSLNFNIANN
jgi:hypothetical protein